MSFSAQTTPVVPPEPTGTVLRPEIRRSIAGSPSETFSFRVLREVSRDPSSAADWIHILDSYRRKIVDGEDVALPGISGSAAGKLEQVELALAGVRSVGGASSGVTGNPAAGGRDAGQADPGRVRLLREHDAAVEITLRDEIPAVLNTRVLIDSTGPGVFWADSFRGFSWGFAFTTRFRWLASERPTRPDGVGDLLTDEWPQFAPHRSGGLPIQVHVTIDGAKFTDDGAFPRQLRLAGDEGVTPGMRKAGWWMPALPKRSLSIGFTFDGWEAAGESDVDFSTWRSAIDHTVVTLAS